jgi:hypothetical protein
MSQLVYNGLPLNVIKTKSYLREAVYNGTAFAKTKHVLTVLAWIGPGTAAYDRGTNIRISQGPDGPTLGIPLLPPRLPNPPVAGNPPPPLIDPPQIIQRGNVPGAISDWAVMRHHLLQPRRTLEYTVGGVRVLTSPLPGYAVDSNNGPIPIRCELVGLYGPRAFLVEYTIQTELRDCASFTSLPSNVISNQFEMQHDLDEHFYAVRTVTGTAVFDRAVLEGGGANNGRQYPDQWRTALAWPIPANFRREQVRVKQREDGVTIDYQFVDRETAVSYAQQNVTKIEGIHTVGNELPWLADKFVENVPVLTLLQNFFTLGAFAGDNSILNGIGNWFVGRGRWDFAQLGKNLSGSVLPVSHHHVQLKVYGNSSASRNQLTNVAQSITDTRLGQAPGGVIFILKQEVSHDLVGTFVMMDTVGLGGPIQFRSGQVPSLAGGPVFPPNNSTGQILNDYSVNGSNAAPPFDGLSRGSYLEMAVASALTTPCNRPSTVAAPPKIAASTNNKYFS